MDEKKEESVKEERDGRSAGASMGNWINHVASAGNIKTVNNTSPKKVASIIREKKGLRARITQEAATMRRCSIKKTMTTCMTKLQQDFLAIPRSVSWHF